MDTQVRDFKEGKIKEFARINLTENNKLGKTKKKD